MRLCTAILLSSCAWGATSGDVRLLDAVKNQDRPAVRNLVKQRAGLQAADEDGTTALIWAAHNDDMETVKLLIDRGAEVNGRSTVFDFNFRKVASGGTNAIYSKGGLTALLLAARQGSVDGAKTLIAAGADLNLAEPDYGFTPLLEAIYNDHYDLAALLVERGAKLDGALYVAVEMHNLDYFGNRPRKPVTDKVDELGLIKLLLERGADPNGMLKTKLPMR